MQKRHLTSAPLPSAKHLHTVSAQKAASTLPATFDSVLSDELVLVIFTYLSWRDLCTIQSTNHHWARLATDNELWKSLFISKYGRLRLRGSRGFLARHEERETKPLLQKAREEDFIDWKWMFRISRNWRKGRCELEDVKEPFAHGATGLKNLHNCALLVGSITVTTSLVLSTSPPICLHKRGAHPYILLGRHRNQSPTHITCLSLDQSPPASCDTTSRLAAFYNSGEFTIFSVDYASPQHSRRLMSYFPFVKSDRTTPIRQAVYHHPLLITLSHAFQLSLYNLSDDNIVHSQTLTSFTSFPPTSMVLTPGPSGYRLVLAYSAPVYPKHWNAAVTFLTISSCHSATTFTDSSEDTSDSELPHPCIVTSSRSVRAYDFPAGWLDTRQLRLMREQWGRKAARVADTQTDGKWVVLAPADALPPSTGGPGTRNTRSRFGTTACAMQLYRLHVSTSSSGGTGSIRMSFVRALHGHTGPVAALALADGRCVSLGVDGSIWVWDLERGWGTEVQAPRSALDTSQSEDYSEELDNDPGDTDGMEDIPMGTPLGAVAFDERRIVTAGAYGIEARRFDI